MNLLNRAGLTYNRPGISGGAKLRAVKKPSKARQNALIWASSICSALMLALVEILRHILSGTLGPSDKGLSSFMIFNLSLYLVGGVLFGGLLIILTYLVPGNIRIGRMFNSALDWLKGEHPKENDISGTILGALAGIVVFIVGSYKASLYFMQAFHDHKLAAVALSIMVLVAAMVAFGIAMALTGVFRNALNFVAGRNRFLASPMFLTGTLGGFTLALGAYLFYRYMDILTAPEAAPALFGLSYFIMFLLFLSLLRTIDFNGPVLHEVIRWGWPVSLLVAITGMSYTFFHLGDDPRISRLTNEETMLSGELVRTFQSWLDIDGDGYASVLGGGDCDDWDPAVHPGAIDIPNNGIDEDCSGEDLRMTASGIEEPPDGALPDELAAGLGTASATLQNQEGLPGKSAVMPAISSGNDKRPDLVMITIDALRGDRLGVAGYPRKLTPNIDKWARANAWFSSAHSQGTATAISFGSMMTSKYPSEVEWGTKRYVPLLSSNLTLAEVLRSFGYYTGAIVTHSYFLPEYGYNQGFEYWDSSLISRVNSIAFNQTTSPAVTKKAIAFLESSRDDPRPRFLWAHYFDPHDHYVFHKGFKRFGTGPMDRYDHEILFTDFYVGKLLDYIKSHNRGRKTYVMLFADHGEAFGEHGYTLHGRHLFEDQINVPLVLAGPDIGPAVIDYPVGLIDVAPTYLALAGLSKPESFRGKDLRRFLNPSYVPNDNDAVFSEFLGTRRRGPKKSLILGSWKLILDLKDREYMLFNLPKDKHEKNNLYTLKLSTARELRRRLARWMSTELKARWAMNRR